MMTWSAEDGLLWYQRRYEKRQCNDFGTIVYGKEEGRSSQGSMKISSILVEERQADEMERDYGKRPGGH